MKREVEECNQSGTKWRGYGIQRICLCVVHYSQTTARPEVGREGGGMNCEIEGCERPRAKTRGSGVSRLHYCVECYTVATARPGEVARTGLERQPKPAPAPVVVELTPPPPPMPKRPVGPSRRVVEAREEAEDRYHALLRWLPSDRLVSTSEVSEVLKCSNAQAKSALVRAVQAGRMAVWPCRGYAARSFCPPATVADQIVAYLQAHDKAGDGIRAGVIAAALEMDLKTINGAARSDSRCESWGRGVLRVRR